MDKKTIGLLGAASAVALIGGAQSSQASSLDAADRLEPARSYAELLDPIQKTPVGRKMRYRHKDGLVVEYVQHDG